MMLKATTPGGKKLSVYFLNYVIHLYVHIFRLRITSRSLLCNCSSTFSGLKVHNFTKISFNFTVTFIQF